MLEQIEIRGHRFVAMVVKMQTRVCIWHLQRVLPSGAQFHVQSGAVRSHDVELALDCAYAAAEEIVDSEERENADYVIGEDTNKTLGL